MIRSIQRVCALLVALALASATLFGLAQTATAASPSLPDGSKTANLHITKEKTPAGAAGNGTQQDPGQPPIAGVQFTVKQVNTIDLTTSDGWSKANQLADTYNAAAPTRTGTAESTVTGAGYTLSTAGTGVTAADGTVNFTGLPLGLYLVEETATPAGVVPSVPFLVTLPLTDPNATSSWLYDVYVYPKNAVTALGKTVKDQSSVKLGDPVTYTITGDIPDSTGANDKLTGYLVTDNLDSKLTYDPSKPATATLSDGTALTAGTDYTVTYDATHNYVEVRFTDAGLAVLGDHRDAQVVVTLPTTVNASGEITNTAELYPSGDSVDSHDGASCPDCAPGTPGGPDSGTPSPPVKTEWGSITVQKTDPNGKALTGAAFKVYTSEADAEAGTNAVSINGKDTFTVGSDGTVTIDGLRYSNFANGATVQPGDPGYQDYYLVEVQAPSGYELLADPVKFDVTADTTAAGVDLTVKDVPANAGFTLPFTGGAGVTLVYAAGLALLAGAFVLAFSRRRRRN